MARHLGDEQADNCCSQRLCAEQPAVGARIAGLSNRDHLKQHDLQGAYAETVNDPGEQVCHDTWIPEEALLPETFPIAGRTRVGKCWGD